MSVPLSDLGPPLLTSWPHDLGCAEAEFYRELGSTNDHARQRIADRIATPALIVAERHCALRDRRITVTQADETWTGRCGGVLPSGRLSLRPEDGDALEFASGTVRVTD